MAGKVVSDAELSDDVYSSSEGSDYENYSQKNNKAILTKKVKKLVYLLINSNIYFYLQAVTTAKKPKLIKENDENETADKVFKQAKKLKSISSSDDRDRPVEEIYQKKTQLEHILLRPDTYIGSVEMITQPMWVYDSTQECMVNRPISFVPGLFKIFDEILVNAADNKIRDLSMDTLKVDINAEKGEISIFNNGRGIPVEIHSKEGIWVPELIFGHLLTSSNYNDDQKKVTGGRNGYGAKLCNIFSTEFIIETADCRVGKKFRQIFNNNMSIKHEPEISNYPRSNSEYTKITFKPDFAKFGMTSMDQDLVALFTKRVYDLAGVVQNVKVFLNGERLKIRNFKQYVELFVNKNESLQQAAAAAGQQAPPLVHSIVNDRWEICFTLSDGQFQQVSFVNSINTYKGGTHVNYVADQIVSELVEAVKKKNKAAPVKPFQVKNHLFVFVNCLIENPTFDSQTKENMTLRQSAFGSKCEIGEDFMKRVMKSGVVENILSWAKFKQDQLLKKTDGAKKSRLSGITKLDDANNAGTKNASRCTLILTEGDSAKALAVSGLSVVGRDNWGVYPLRGKLLNVREASHKQIMDNNEINQIKQIMGLQHGKQYTSLDTLRYGRLMIMTDQDHDGSHIKGLLINFLDHFWPSLLKIPGFLVEFITPIVKCTRGRQEVTFFTIPEYEVWKSSNDNGRGWTIKYYKGLGTSTAADAKKYFSDLPTHLKEFQVGTDEDRSLIDMAFNKKKADNRKDWLKNFVPGTFMDHARAQIPLKDFINHELILFSQADNIRSIPSIVDGFKPGHRKIMYACFKRKLKAEIKVAQLAGYVAEHSAYHHGEQSLCATIVGLAQSFVGSNNINMLEPNGQFGTRLQGGKDAASPRYIFTTLSPLSRLLLRSEDDALLKYLNDDGQSIEPEWYIPILPMVLVNGGEGIGTGWSTFIPNYNPLDLVDCIELILDNSSSDGEIAATLSHGADINEVLRSKLVPWYRGFTGSIEAINSDKYKITGTWTKLDAETLEINELPIGTWTQNYKEMLEGMLTGSAGTDRVTNTVTNEDGTTTTTTTNSRANVPPFIKDYREYHTDTTVKFIVSLSANNMAAAEAEGIDKKFKLTSTLSTGNLVCFDSLGRIRKYSAPIEILLDFYPLRLAFYQRRKAHLVNQLTQEWHKLEMKVKFIEEIADGRLQVQNKKKAALIEELRSLGYKTFDEKSADNESTDSADENETATEASISKEFDYLLNMQISSLTLERANSLRLSRDEKEGALQSLLALSPKDLWRADLKEFKEKYIELEAELTAKIEEEVKKKTAGVAALKKKAVKAKASELTAAAVKLPKSTPATSQSSLDSFISFKQQQQQQQQQKKTVVDDDEDDEMNLSLTERINRMISKKSASAAVNITSEAPVKAQVKSLSKSSSTASVTKSNACKPVNQRKAPVIVSDDEDSSYDSDEEDSAYSE